MRSGVCADGEPVAVELEDLLAGHVGELVAEELVTVYVKRFAQGVYVVDAMSGESIDPAEKLAIIAVWSFEPPTEFLSPGRALRRGRPLLRP